MKKWSWTLLFGAVVVLLLLWATRENYENYAEALKRIGQDTGYAGGELTCPNEFTLTPDKKQCITDMRTTPCPAGSVKRQMSDRHLCSTEPTRSGVGSAGEAPADAATRPDTLEEKCRAEVTNKEWSNVSQECKDHILGAGKDTSTGNSTGGDKKPTGNSTGGSGLIPGSNSGGLAGAPLSGGSGARSSKGNIWGPAYTGMGDNAGDGRGNSKRDYPTLIGPKPKESRMVEGAGIANVSQHRTLVTSGTLPGSANTGSDPSSQFFGTSRVPGDQGSGSGTSRVPGDQDLIPNPYLEFTPSVGSSKTEPIPYLSDFSAFFH